MIIYLIYIMNLKRNLNLDYINIKNKKWEKSGERRECEDSRERDVRHASDFHILHIF